MKLRQIILPAALTMTSIASYAQQLPNSFNYQAVINADDGTPVASKEITVEVSVLQGTDCDKNPSGCSVLWQELHTPTTNEFGLFTVEIGASSATNTHVGSADKYSDINWVDVSAGYYFLKVRADFGESEYLNGMNDLGTSKFSSVPYSLVSLTTEQAETAKALAKNTDGNVALKLSELADVNVPSTATDGQILVLRDGKWEVEDAPQGGTPGTSVTKLSELTGDVSISSPAADQILKYNGTKWVNGTASPSVTKLSELTGDVSVSSPATNQHLVYNGTKWTNQDLSLSQKVSDLTDVKLTSLATGQILKYDGTNWINSAEGSDWQKSSTVLYTKQYNVGIGTDKPGALFEVGKQSTSGTSATVYTQMDGRDIKLSAGNIILVASSTVAETSQGSIVGAYGKATQINCIAMGGEAGTATASGNSSMAFGAGCNTLGANNSAAIGYFVKLPGDNTLACGKYNAKPTNAVFMVGYGTSETDRKNVFEVLNTGEANLSGTLAQSSDSRLKTNVSTLENALDEVMKLRGVTFNWDLSKKPSASTSLQYGFIAQEVEKVFPNLVTTDGSGYKSLNYIGIIPVLTEAVKAQQTEIETLKSENAELKSTLESLLKRVEALENK